MNRFLDSAMTLLGIGFLVAAGVKLSDPAAGVEVFASWGVSNPTWVPLAAWTEFVIGLMLLNPSTRRLGAAVISIWLAGWASVQLRSGATGPAAASAGFLLPAAVFSVVSRRAWIPEGALMRPLLRERPNTPWKAIHELARLVGMAFMIRWIVGGVAYWLAIPIFGWLHARGEELDVIEAVALYLLVLGVGVSGIWGFIGHTFMTDIVSESVGWRPSPFQRELAFYHLAVGFGGLACWWLRDHFWLAIAVVVSLFMYGAGWVHLHDFLTTGNRAPTNWGFGVFFGGVVVPTALLVIVGVRSRRLLQNGDA